MGEGPSYDFLSFLQIFLVINQYTHITVHPATPEPEYHPIFCDVVLRCHTRPLMVWPSLKYTCTPCLSHAFFKLSLSCCIYGTTVRDFFFLWPGVLWFCWLLLLSLVLFPGLDLWMFLNFLLFISPLGYLHFYNTSSRCACSWCSSCWLEHTALALWKRVLMALYIRVNNPSLNKNIGEHHQPHIWDETLFNTSELNFITMWPNICYSGCSTCHHE